MKQQTNPHSTAQLVLLDALDALERWDRGATLQELIQPGPQRRMLTHLLYAYFRNLAVIDWIIDRFCRQRPEDCVEQLLRLGICELLYVDGLPAPIAVDTCIRVAKRCLPANKTGFVNAVLRSVCRETPAALLDKAAAGPEWVRLGLSTELCDQWQHLTPGQRDDISHILRFPAPVIIRRCANSPDAAPTPPELVPITSPPWAPEASLWECQDPEAFLNGPDFTEGGYYVQDPSTLLAPSLLAIQPGDRVADLCAAPGGKALVLAEALAGTGHLVCADRSWNRCPQLREKFCRATSLDLCIAQAETPPFADLAFDAVLLDVPCSNTGVLRRRPDVRWRFTREGLVDLTALQRDILEGACRLVKPGGRLVYSTCSIEPEENRDLIRHFLSRHSEFALDEERQLLPEKNWDGAYAARLRRAVT